MAKRSRRIRPLEIWVVAGDLHIPFHDPTALALFIAFCKSIQPDRVFLNGDILDCWEISKFDKPLSIKQHLTDELDQGTAFFKALRLAVPDAMIDWLLGNHEFRWERFLGSKAPELYGLKYMTLEEQVDCTAQGVTVHNAHLPETMVQVGKLLIGHFAKVNKHSAYTAKNLLDEKGISLIQAHTHRMGAHYRTDYNRTLVAFEGGCLCSLDPPYLSRPNWQQGWTVVAKDPDSDFFKLTAVEIIKGRVIYGNQMIESAPPVNLIPV